MAPFLGRSPTLGLPFLGSSPYIGMESHRSVTSEANLRAFWLTTTFLTLSVAGAMAAITPQLGVGQPQPSIFPSAQCTATPGYTGECWSWSYELSMAQNTKLDSSQSELQLLVIYDFAGFTGAYESASGNWMLMSQPAQGPTGAQGLDLDAPYAWFPLNNDPSDSAAVNNLVFQWTGPVVGSTFTDLLTVESIYSNPVSETFRGQGTKINPGTIEDDKAHGTAGPLTVPGPGQGGGEIPEPATMALFGAGLTALGFIKFRRNR